MFDRKFSRPPAELARQNFSTAGYANEYATETATDTATEIHKCSAVKSPLGAQTVLGDRHDLIYEILLQVQSAACGTRPRELSNGWIRKRIRDGSEKRSSENLIRQRRQRTDLNPGEFASRASLRSCPRARRRARWISARSMFEPGGKSVRCQNLHEPYLSPSTEIQRACIN